MVVAVAVAGLSAWLWFIEPLVSLHRARRRGENPHEHDGAERA
ncbi:hypothetical protein ACFFHJ_03885 [Planotetraspora thailandica]|nr:hypothetical protein [Planotetraspora thailandica]